MVSLASYFIGKWSYKGELRRRLEATPLNTPFIQTLRSMVGAQAPISSMGEFSGDTSQDYSTGLYNKDQPQGWAFSDIKPGDGGLSGRPQGSPSTFGQPSGYSQYNQELPNPTYQPYEPDPNISGTQPSGEPPKPVYSYEELRARNRGLVPK